jgi:hypothetical protein
MMDKILLNKEDFNKINKTIKLILNIENSNNIKIKDKNILKNEDLMLKKQIRNEWKIKIGYMITLKLQFNKTEVKFIIFESKRLEQE